MPESAWQRRGGKALVKLLAAEPGHRLHREQILDLLWPDLEPESALNSFRKALHFARHALEPELPRNGRSSYLWLSDDTVALVAEHVRIDVDQFQKLAKDALARGEEAACEMALVAYGGELLPEDRYEDWSVAHREGLEQLHLRLLVNLAGALERRGAYSAAAERLQSVLLQDPTHEEVQRSLMRLYALAGSRHRALRQYQACRDVLRREVDAEPEPATTALYHEILAGRLGSPPRAPEAVGTSDASPLPAALRDRHASPLIGREQALASLLHDLARAAEGNGGVVLIGGEAGVGKSRLAAEAAREAHQRGALVLWGAGYEREGQLPYGPLVEALDGYLAGCPALQQQGLATAYPELAGLIPSLPPSVPKARPRAGLESDRTRLFAAIVRLLGDLSLSQSMLLVLDDLHVADAASLQLLQHLGRSAAGHRWLIVGTYREEDVEAGGIFQRLSAAFTREGLCRRIDLRCLDRPDCDRLVQMLLPGGMAGPALLGRLHALSLGNPLFVQEIVGAMSECGDLTLVDGHWQVSPHETMRVPRQVQDLVETRVYRMGDEVRRTLALAAVAGMESSFAVLRSTGELAVGPLLDALDRALEVRILEERGEGYAFRHPLVRAALYERLSQLRRSHLHAAVAKAMEQTAGAGPEERPEAVEALAYHWQAAGRPDRAVPYLVRAGEWAAEIYANEAAISRFRRALTLLDGGGRGRVGDQVHRAAVLERLGDLYALGGQNEQAREAYTEAWRCGITDPLATARVQRKAAHKALLAGDLAAAEGLLGEAEAQLGRAEPGRASAEERARLLVVLAHERWLAYRFPEALTAAEESARIAEAIDAEADLAQAYEMMALACLPLGEWKRGMEYERRRASLVDLNRDVAEVADVHV